MWWKILYNKAIKNSHQNIKFGASFLYFTRIYYLHKKRPLFFTVVKVGYFGYVIVFMSL